MKNSSRKEGKLERETFLRGTLQLPLPLRGTECTQIKLFRIGQSGEDLFFSPGDQNPPREIGKKSSRQRKLFRDRPSLVLRFKAFLERASLFVRTSILTRLFGGYRPKASSRMLLRFFGIRR